MTAHRLTQTRKTDPELARGAILDVYNLSLAVFLFVSPWLFAYSSGATRIDFWASSALIAVASAAAIVAFSDWEEWLNLLLGIWLISAPWLLGYAHTGAMHVSIGVGVIVTYLAGLRIWLAHYGDRAEQQDGTR
jgi:SPW repeat